MRPANDVNEDRVRRLAVRRGYVLSKSRQPNGSDHHHGDYRLVDEYDSVVLGEHYDATLDDVERFLTDEWRIGKRSTTMGQPTT